MYKFIYWFNFMATVSFLSIFTGCTSFGSFEPAPGIDPELRPYVELFEKEAKIYLGDNYEVPKMDIDLGDSSLFTDTKIKKTVGWCKTRVRQSNQIMISEASWRNYNEFQKEQLIFHELGHCALNRGHRDTLTPLDQPVSLMHSSMFNSSYYESDRDLYIEELFTNIVVDRVDEKLHFDGVSSDNHSICGGEH